MMSNNLTDKPQSKRNSMNIKMMPETTLRQQLKRNSSTTTYFSNYGNKLDNWFNQKLMKDEKSNPQTSSHMILTEGILKNELHTTSKNNDIPKLKFARFNKKISIEANILLNQSQESDTDYMNLRIDFKRTFGRYLSETKPKFYEQLQELLDTKNSFSDNLFNAYKDGTTDMKKLLKVAMEIFEKVLQTNLINKDYVNNDGQSDIYERIQKQKQEKLPQKKKDKEVSLVKEKMTEQKIPGQKIPGNRTSQQNIKFFKTAPDIEQNKFEENEFGRFDKVFALTKKFNEFFVGKKLQSSKSIDQLIALGMDQQTSVRKRSDENGEIYIEDYNHMEQCPRIIRSKSLPSDFSKVFGYYVNFHNKEKQKVVSPRKSSKNRQNLNDEENIDMVSDNSNQFDQKAKNWGKKSLKQQLTQKISISPKASTILKNLIVNQNPTDSTTPGKKDVRKSTSEKDQHLKSKITSGNDHHLKSNITSSVDKHKKLKNIDIWEKAAEKLKLRQNTRDRLKEFHTNELCSTIGNKSQHSYIANIHNKDQCNTNNKDHCNTDNIIFQDQMHSSATRQVHDITASKFFSVNKFQINTSPTIVDPKTSTSKPTLKKINEEKPLLCINNIEKFESNQDVTKESNENQQQEEIAKKIGKQAKGVIRNTYESNHASFTNTQAHIKLNKNRIDDLLKSHSLRHNYCGTTKATKLVNLSSTNSFVNNNGLGPMNFSRSSSSLMKQPSSFLEIRNSQNSRENQLPSEEKYAIDIDARNSYKPHKSYMEKISTTRNPNNQYNFKQEKCNTKIDNSRNDISRLISCISRDRKNKTKNIFDIASNQNTGHFGDYRVGCNNQRYQKGFITKNFQTKVMSLKRGTNQHRNTVDF